MKQFLAVLRFELAGYFKNKVYTALTLIFVLVVAGVLTYPRLRDAINPPSGTGAGNEPGMSRPAGPVLALLNENGALTDEALERFESSLPQFQAQAVTLDEQALREQVAQGSYAGAVVFKSVGEALYIVPSVGMYDDPGALIEGALADAWRTQRLTALGVPAQELKDILAPPVMVRVENLGISQFENFFYTYILIFALYMAIMIYGQLISTAVATEKGSRTMELLITSARPNSLLFGKIIGSGLAGLIQMTVILGAAVVFYHLNAAVWAGNAIIASIFNMPLSIVGFALLFFVLGYFLYAFLFGMVGSLASRVEDVSGAALPIMLCFIVAFMVVVTSISSGSIDNAAMVFCSYFPLTSPMAMFARIAMSSPAWYEIILSVVILLVSVAGIGALSAKVYRVGVLMYGKPPKAGELIRVLKAQRRAHA